LSPFLLYRLLKGEADNLDASKKKKNQEVKKYKLGA